MKTSQWQSFEPAFSLRLPPAMRGEPGAKEIWLVNLRWVAIFAQILCVAPGLALGFLPPSALPAYLGIVGSLAAFNFCITRLRRRGESITESTLLLHLIVDVTALCVLLLLSGAGANPLAALFYLNAALGPLILSGARNLLFLGAIVIAFTIVSLGTGAPDGAAVPRNIILAAELTVLALMWQITRWVAYQLADLWENLRGLEEQKTRIDNLRALGAMAASFSHGFATPLNTVKLRLDRMSRAAAADPSADLASARQAVQQCESALHSLLHVEAGPVGAKVDDIALTPFVESACRNWMRDQPHAALRFAAEDGAAGVRCRIPGLILTRSLIDLLDNAVQASPVGGAEIDVSIHVDGGRAVIEIADRGGGMSTEVRLRIGEPFNSTRSGGSGLGLFTAHSVASAFGGELTARERDGGGTVIALSLPDVRGAR